MKYVGHNFVQKGLLHTESFDQKRDIPLLIFEQLRHHASLAKQM